MAIPIAIALSVSYFATEDSAMTSINVSRLAIVHYLFSFVTIAQRIFKGHFTNPWTFYSIGADNKLVVTVFKH